MKSKIASRGDKDKTVGAIGNRVLIVGGPPISLSTFVAQMGINVITAWRWRKDGKLKTVNICGRQYVRSEDMAEFNRRVASGEFAREHKTPRNSRFLSPSRRAAHR